MPLAGYNVFTLCGYLKASRLALSVELYFFANLYLCLAVRFTVFALYNNNNSNAESCALDLFEAFGFRAHCTPQYTLKRLYRICHSLAFCVSHSTSFQLLLPLLFLAVFFHHNTEYTFRAYIVVSGELNAYSECVDVCVRTCLFTSGLCSLVCVQSANIPAKKSIKSSPRTQDF